MIDMNENQQWLTKARMLYKLREQLRSIEREEKQLAEELKGLSNHESARGGGIVFAVST
jgi:hypothetical protein